MHARMRSAWLGLAAALAVLVGGMAPGWANAVALGQAGPAAAGAAAERGQSGGITARLVRITGDPARATSRSRPAQPRPDTAYLVIDDRRIAVPLSLIRGMSGGEVTVTLNGITTSDPRAAADALARGTATVASVSPPADARNGTELGEHDVLVVPVYWTQAGNVPSDLPASFAASADYYDDNTAGKITFSEARILAPQKISMTSSQLENCEYDAVEDQVRRVIGSTPHDRFHHVVAAMEQIPGCWWGGLATIGPGEEGDGFVWLNGNAWSSIVAHEFGHNLGLSHSGSLTCVDSRGTAVPLSGECESTTYADQWDLMGNQLWGFGAIGAFNLDRLGVLEPGARQVISGSATVTLKPLEDGTGLRSVALIDGDAQYEIEYRVPKGYDAFIDDEKYYDNGVWRTWPGGGVIIRRLDYGHDSDQYDVIDFHPRTGEEFYKHPGLEAGESFTWPGSRRAIKVETTSSTGATITISRPHGSVVRWHGEDRYLTSLAIARNGFAGSGDGFYIASGSVFTDALSGAGVAGAAGNPLLLTRANDLPYQYVGLLYAMQPPLATLLGGPASVGPLVEEVAGQLALRTRRLAGADRYEASAAISKASFDPGVDVAYVASGQVFPDALSGAPVAGITGGPMLLTAPGALPVSIATELSRLQPKRIVVLGGPTSISDAVVAQIAQAAGVGPTRISGADRYEVSASVSRANFAADTDGVFVASGAIFTDALSGAPVAVTQRSPMLLVTAGRIPDAIRAELTRLNPRTIVILGGPNSVGSGVATALQDYLRP